MQSGLYCRPGAAATARAVACASSFDGPTTNVSKVGSGPPRGRDPLGASTVSVSPSSAVGRHEIHAANTWLGTTSWSSASVWSHNVVITPNPPSPTRPRGPLVPAPQPPHPHGPHRRHFRNCPHP